MYGGTVGSIVRVFIRFDRGNQLLKKRRMQRYCVRLLTAYVKHSLSCIRSSSSAAPLLRQQPASTISKDIIVPNRQKWPDHLTTENVLEDCTIVRDFITENEEQLFMQDVALRLKRLRYETSHWDDAIHLYRETEKSDWSSECAAIISRVRQNGFPPDAHHSNYVHVLDLHKDGWIKPHIDAARYCGDTIAGISLLSDAVMRLIHKDFKEVVFDIMLHRRSFYIMTGVVRHEFTHEVLKESESDFGGVHVHRDRRVSVICRDMPKKCSH